MNDTKRHFDENGYLHVESSHITKEAVNPYYGREIPGWKHLSLDPEKIYYGYRSGDELQKALKTFNGLPLHLDHHMDSAANPRKDVRVGSLGTSALWNPPYIDNALTVTDLQAIKAIENNEYRELSAAYRYDPDFIAGEFNGEKYDFVMRNISGNHVALVRDGRAGPDVVVADENTIKENKMPDNEKKTNEETAAKDSDIGSIKDAAKSLAAAMQTFAAALQPFLDEEAGESAHAADDGETAAKTNGATEQTKKAMDSVGCDAEDPSQQKAFAEGVKFGEKKEKEEPKKLDSEHESEGARAAMDAALVEERIVKKFRAQTAAANAVRPLVGEIIDPLAFDSAESIYKKALELSGVSTAGYSTQAYKGMVDVLLKNNRQKIGAAMDSKPATELTGSFAGLKNVRISN